MKHLAVFVVMLLFATGAVALSHSWVNDGADGWTAGDNWDSDNVNVVKDSLDLILSPYDTINANSHVFSPDAWTGVVASGTDLGRIQEEIWITADGKKDVGDKSTIAGRLDRVYALTEAENYGETARLYCGADSDCIGKFIMVWATGGAQIDGDEGIQSIRASSYDSWGTTRGTLTDPIASGAGTTAVSVDPTTAAAAEAKMAGENKLIVFTADAEARTVDIVTAPAGTYDENGALRGDSGTWSTGPNQFVLGSGQGAAAGLAVGDCFTANLNDFTDWDGGTSSAWLYITAVSTDTITTEWIGQGTDYEIPWGYLAEVGTGTGRVAPCGKLGIPTLNSSYALTGLSVTTGTGFPGVADNSTFEIPPYPGTYHIYGITSRIGQNFGHVGGGTHAFVGLNSMTVLSGSRLGRYQLKSVVDTQYSGDLADMVDGNYHAFENGFRCGNGDCEFGFNYIYKSDTGELGPTTLQQSFAQIDFSTEDWDDDIHRPVIDIPRFSAGLPAWDLTIDKTDGWAQNGDPFMRLGATQTITGAKTLTGSLSATGGTVTVATASAGDNDTSAASTAFVTTAVNAKSAASSTDNTLPRFDSTAGDLQTSGIVVDDSNNMTVPGTLTTGGSEVPTCLILRDSDDAGNSACAVLNGTFSCETDTNGVCGDAT